MAYVIRTPYRCFDSGERFSFARFICCALLLIFSVTAVAEATDSGPYDQQRALQISQAAIGNTLGDYRFFTADGQTFSLSDLGGRPYLISMIFTSCHHICPTTTRHIEATTAAAREVLGADSFVILSIGFDSANDTPDAMRNFARQQGIDADNWHFLSADAATIAALSQDLGFQFFSSPRGFDHLNQVSVIDRQGDVYSQVYGMNFQLPALVEPLKQLVFNRPQSTGHPFSGLVDRLRLFCTVFNPATGRYEIDNSLFIQTTIGLMIVLSVLFYLLREAYRARRQ